MLRCARGMAALSQIRWMAQIHLSAKCHQLVIPLPEMSPEPSGALVKKGACTISIDAPDRRSLQQQFEVSEKQSNDNRLTRS